MPHRVRMVEVLAALSLTTDLTSGVGLEKGLRTCVVATAFAGSLGLDVVDRSAVFHAALLRAIGCTSYASENAALFEDDMAFQAAMKVLDPGDPAVFQTQLAEFGSWAGANQQRVAQRFFDVLAIEGVNATRSSCGASRALGSRLGMPTAAVDALDDVFERWDDMGIPDGRRGEGLSPVPRVVHVAEQAVAAHAVAGSEGARSEVLRRSGGHLDPDLCVAAVDGRCGRAREGPPALHRHGQAPCGRRGPGHDRLASRARRAPSGGDLRARAAG